MSLVGYILRSFRKKLVRRYINHRLIRKDYTVISDDCWGGRLYADLGLKCRSPFILMGFTASEYINFLCQCREPGALDVISISSEERGYPIIQTRHARLFGQHYTSEAIFRTTYERRCKTILWDRVFIKINLGNPKYRPEDIARWNELKLPNSVAIYPDEPRFKATPIHNGVALPDWEKTDASNGYRQFYLSTLRFDILHWLNHGTIRNTLAYQCAHFVFQRKFFFHIQ